MPCSEPGDADIDSISEEDQASQNVMHQNPIHILSTVRIAKKLNTFAESYPVINLVS
jgi:hypothetical protein